MEYGSDEWWAARIRSGLESGDFCVNADGYVVCSTCGGNCGQCGSTDVLGCAIPASISAIAKAFEGQRAQTPVSWWGRVRAKFWRGQ